MTSPVVQFRPLTADGRFGLARRDRARVSADDRRLCTGLLSGFAPSDATWPEPWCVWEGDFLPDLVQTSLGFFLFSERLRRHFAGLRTSGPVTWHKCHLVVEGHAVQLATPEMERPRWVVDESRTVVGSSGLPMKVVLDPRVRAYQVVAALDGGPGLLLREDVVHALRDRFSGVAVSAVIHPA